MSTRSTTHFLDAEGATPTAIIYRHTDGYPDGAGADIATFLDRVGKLRDTRFDDPSYLAAKYVVFLAELFHEYEKENGSTEPMEFLGVGVIDADPSDIEYRYDVISGSQRRPLVRAYDVGMDGGTTYMGTIEADGRLKPVEPAPTVSD